MPDIDLPQTPNTPRVVADSSRGTLSMAGDSYPEDPFAFFQPIMDWVHRHLEGQAPLTVELELVYLNTSSVRSMMDLFDRLQEAHDAGQAVAVRWTYHPDNERVGELAEEFKEDYTFPFAIEARP